MPTLHSDIEVLLSTTRDGSLRSSETPEPTIGDSATHDYLVDHDIEPAQATLLCLSYDTDDFCKYHEVTPDEVGAGFIKPQVHVADALVTQVSDVALFLPIADCIGAVLYHPQTRTLLLSHLGRHNLEQQGGVRSVEYLAQYGVNPSELLAYLSPAADKKRYPLFAFDNQSLHEVATQQLVQAGVLEECIMVDTRDTVADLDFFSHSAFLRGEKPRGRHAIVCYIKQ